MLYILLYLIAIILANLSVAIFGRNFPQITIVNALLFIGLDLTARDQLHEAWRGRGLLPKMLALIAAGSALSWLLNRAAGAGLLHRLCRRRRGGYPGLPAPGALSTLAARQRQQCA